VAEVRILGVDCTYEDPQSATIEIVFDPEGRFSRTFRLIAERMDGMDSLLVFMNEQEILDWEMPYGSRDAA
jgi:hypothetical protein